MAVRHTGPAEYWYCQCIAETSDGRVRVMRGPEIARCVLCKALAPWVESECGCDRHPDPAKQNWSAWLSADLDVDARHRTIIVAKSNGSHVTEADAEWIRERLR
jgi:hypothetical protein